MPAGPFDANSPPYDVHCASGGTSSAQYASWLDAPSVTPVDRYFGFVGMLDVEYGDSLFAMWKLGFIGPPTDITASAPPFGGTHQILVSNEGHIDFLDAASPALVPADVANIDAALDIAFGVLPENMNPTF